MTPRLLLYFAQTVNARAYGSTLVVLLFAMTLAIAGCGHDKQSSDADNNHGYEHLYTVRGRVTSLPSESPNSTFRLHHEAIPDYVALNGTLGMNSMDMSFSLPDPKVVEGLALGDIVEIVYGESLNPRVKQGVVSVTVLPADTVLEFDEEQREDATDEQ